jgi:hypothetical protein
MDYGSVSDIEERIRYALMIASNSRQVDVTYLPQFYTYPVTFPKLFIHSEL